MAALKAFLFGITIAVTVGPIAVLIMQFGLSQGFRVAMSSAAGAAMADFSFALVAFTVGAVVAPRLVAAESMIQWIASVVLCAFGLWMLVRAARRASAAETVQAAVVDPHKAFLGTYLLTIVNPLTVVAFLGLALQLPLSGSLLQAVGYASCLAVGSLAVQTLFAAGSASARFLLASPAVLVLLEALSGAGILLFGLLGLPLGEAG